MNSGKWGKLQLIPESPPEANPTLNSRKRNKITTCQCRRKINETLRCLELLLLLLVSFERRLRRPGRGMSRTLGRKREKSGGGGSIIAKREAINGKSLLFAAKNAKCDH